MSSTAYPGEETKPLSEREQKLLWRLFSDPTVYPMTFKSWLIPFLEITDMDLPMMSVHGLLDELNKIKAAPARMAPGTVLTFAGTTPPEGTLELDGSTLLRTNHPILFALLAANPHTHVIDADHLKLPKPNAPQGLIYVVVTGGT